MDQGAKENEQGRRSRYALYLGFNSGPLPSTVNFVRELAVWRCSNCLLTCLGALFERPSSHAIPRLWLGCTTDHTIVVRMYRQG